MGTGSSSGIKKTGLEKAKNKLRKEGYGIIGDHSAVKVCLWTKHALRGDRGCWKEKFYGISSAGCAQATPSLFHCENRCLHCWRNLDFTTNEKIDGAMDPIEILDGIVEERKRLMEGFAGNKKVDKEKLEEAFTPSLFTMSLSGEPTIYPRLGEIFAEIRKRGAVSFLVTNGLNPEALEKLNKNGGQLPTQITISTNAPNEKLFLKWHRTTKKEAWRKFNESLSVLAKLEGRVRRVVRMTLVKPGHDPHVNMNLTNMTDKNLEEYTKLIKKANPDFVHVKGFKSVGYSRDRLGYDKMPSFEEVKQFAKGLESELKDSDYKIAGEDERCCVVLIAKKGKKLKIKEV